MELVNKLLINLTKLPIANINGLFILDTKLKATIQNLVFSKLSP